jgi:hypothetical protein
MQLDAARNFLWGSIRVAAAGSPPQRLQGQSVYSPVWSLVMAW